MEKTILFRRDTFKSRDLFKRNLNDLEADLSQIQDNMNNTTTEKGTTTTLKEVADSLEGLNFTELDAQAIYNQNT
jgi:hypothetical protein